MKSFDTADGIAIGVGLALDVGLRLIKGERVTEGAPIKSSFERIAIENRSLKAKKSSDIILFGVTPTVSVASHFVFDDPQRSIYLSLETILLTDVTNLLAKKLVKRRRPFTYDDNIVHSTEKCKAYNPENHDANLSFYSGHTAHVAAVVFFTNTMLWYYKPEFRTKDWMWMVSSALPAVVGYQRVRAGKHFPSDVMVGLIAGSLAGYFIPRVHENEQSSGDLTEDFLIGLGTGLAIQYLLIKAFGNKRSKHDCSSKGKSISNLKLSPMFGEYSGIKFSLKL